ncbi:MAG TPA: hypothetical protein VNO87_09800, partial [Methylomirabilota bacterium]|nr:hypothetical protein [Methylomirabilota bacterium]
VWTPAVPDLPGLDTQSGHLPVDGQRVRWSHAPVDQVDQVLERRRWLTRYQNERDRIEAATERGRTAMGSQCQPADRLSHERGNQVRERSQPPGR